MIMLEHPAITNAMRTGYPDGKEPLYPRCPVCGAECSFIYKYEGSEISGCDICLSAEDAWEVPECFPEE